MATKKEDYIHKNQVATMVTTKKEGLSHKNQVADEESQRQLMKQKMLFDQQQREIQVENEFIFIMFNLCNFLLQKLNISVLDDIVGAKAYSSLHKRWYAVHANEIS